MPYDTENRVAYLERNIAEVSAEIERIGALNFGGAHADGELKLLALRHRMQDELNAIRPFKICDFFGRTVVAYEGNFITDDDGEYRFFEDAEDAQRYIDTVTVGEVA